MAENGGGICMGEATGGENGGNPPPTSLMRKNSGGSAKTKLQQHSPSTIVRTKFGDLEGFQFTLSTGRTAEIFLGIPYAKPPIGDLRFEASGFCNAKFQAANVFTAAETRADRKMDRNSIGQGIRIRKRSVGF